MKWFHAKAAVVAGIISGVLFTTSAPAQDKAPKNEKEPILLQSLGALTGIYLYQTHTALGMIHDAKAKGIYDDKTAKQQLVTLINMANLVDKQLEAAGQSGIQKDDQTVIAIFRMVNGQLQKEAFLLKTLWESKSKKDAEAFVKQRGETFAKIANLLGIK
jgi:hypothetical protein